MTARTAMLVLYAALVGCSHARDGAHPQEPGGGGRGGAPLDGSAGLSDGSAPLTDGGSLADAAEPTCPVGTPGDALTVATAPGLVKGMQGNVMLAFLRIPYPPPPLADPRS